MEQDDFTVDTPGDEFNYWKRMEENATSPDAKKKAQYFQECYKDIEAGWANFAELDLRDIKELF